jgi:hypothetical protein
VCRPAARPVMYEQVSIETLTDEQCAAVKVSFRVWTVCCFSSTAIRVPEGSKLRLIPRCIKGYAPCLALAVKEVSLVGDFN